MSVNEICLGCKKLCKKLVTEDARNCPDYDPRPVKKDTKKEGNNSSNVNSRIVIRRR